MRTLTISLIVICSILFHQLSAQNNFTPTINTSETGCGVGTGTATVSVPIDAGTLPYTFVLMPGNIVQTSFSGSALFMGLTAGNYTLSLKDASNVCATPTPFSITSTGLLSISFTSVNTSCEGAANGTITIDPPVATSPVMYSIDGSPFTASNIFSGLAPGIYSINVKDAAGCEAKDIPVKIDPGTPIAMSAGSIATSCPDLNDGSITVTGSSGTSPFEYAINGSNYQSSPVFSNLGPGTYVVSLHDALGCTASLPEVKVVRGDVPVIHISPVDTLVAEGAHFQLKASSTGVNYTWSPPLGLSNAKIPNPVVTVSSVTGEEIVYHVTATTVSGCHGEGYATVRVQKGSTFYVPTAFTPNHDGRNDEFIPVSVGIKQLNYFRVYNRAGQLLYSTTTLQKGWDGTVTGKVQADGVYVWVLQGITQNGAIINKQGTVALVR